MEGQNGYLKNPNTFNIGASGVRRFRGWGKQNLALLVKLLAANIDIIQKFTRDGGMRAARSAKMGRKPKKPVSAWLPEGDEPSRIVGRPPRIKEPEPPGEEVA